MTEITSTTYTKQRYFYENICYNHRLTLCKLMKITNNQKMKAIEIEYNCGTQGLAAVTGRWEDGSQ